MRPGLSVVWNGNYTQAQRSFWQVLLISWPDCSDAANLLNAIYHDHGDTLALQYGGSHLVNTMETCMFYERSNLKNRPKDISLDFKFARYDWKHKALLQQQFYRFVIDTHLLNQTLKNKMHSICFLETTNHPKRSAHSGNSRRTFTCTTTIRFDSIQSEATVIGTLPKTFPAKTE